MRRIKIHKDQLSLPFGAQTLARVGYEKRELAFWALATISIVSILAYMYAINATARNIANRQNLEIQITEISRDLDKLEFDYITLRNNVTIELAYEKGFTEEKSPLFV